MATAQTKTCPKCGAINDANDIFCKDCGHNIEMVSAANEQTATYTPIQQPMETQTTAVAPAMPPQPTEQYSYPVAENPAYAGTVPPQESVRGAVLGWLAATLLLLIVGFFVWSSLLSDATRDRFTGWF